MNESHVDSVLLLAVPFHQDADFDFGKQTITQDIQVYLSLLYEVHSFLLTTVPETFSIGWPGSNVLPCGNGICMGKGFAIMHSESLKFTVLLSFFSNVNLSFLCQ
jgi:hypothetical protein